VRALIEKVVHADADNVFLKSAACNEHKRGRGGYANGLCAEIDVKVFGFEGPMLGEFGFHPAAAGPSAVYAGCRAGAADVALTIQPLVTSAVLKLVAVSP
jgi:hypothetical protein